MSTLSEGQKQKQFDREIREMLSALIHGLSDLKHVQKHGSSHHEGDEDEHAAAGVKIITLAGTNTGATMRSQLDEKPSLNGQLGGDHEPSTTYVNSNFQAVNNSIMLGGSYSTNDPGVHMDIAEYEGHHHRRGKKKVKESSESDQYSQHSD